MEKSAIDTLRIIMRAVSLAGWRAIRRQTEGNCGKVLDALILIYSDKHGASDVEESALFSTNSYNCLVAALLRDFTYSNGAINWQSIATANKLEAI